MNKEIEKTEDNRMKHLEFIENNIVRMNNCSFQMKGWAITLIAAFIALYAASFSDCGEGNVAFLFAGTVPTAIFWCLDAYYLQKEKKFMALYKDVAGLSKENAVKSVKSFDMSVSGYEKAVGCRYIDALRTTSVGIMYLFLIVALVVLGIVL